MSKSKIEEYKKYARKPAKNQVVRLDQEHFKNIEILRMLHSDDFSSPSTADIIRIVLQYYVDNVEDPKERDLAQEALWEVLNQDEE